MKAIKAKRLKHVRRRMRVRKKVVGTPERPRLSVFRSLKHMYAQIIDDTVERTLVAASTRNADVRPADEKATGCAAAKAVGRRLAEKAIAHGVRTVVFDRSGYRYHGRVKALADAAREAGLVF